MFLNKALDTLVLADLQALVEAGTRESDELEFKGALPFKPEKGNAATADRWIEKGDRVGDYARDQLLAEIVAFANAGGGTLVIGISETTDEPRRASVISPLPRCEELLRRLVDAAEDTIEPRLPTISSKSIAADEEGNGCLVIRVGPSHLAPHRLRSTREFYVRRGERAAKMDVREIKDMTLMVARSGDQVASVFAEYRTEAARKYEARLSERNEGEDPPLLLRVTAVPMLPTNLPGLTAPPYAWWMGSIYSILVGDTRLHCQYPSRDFNRQARISLRALIDAPYTDDDGLYRSVRADGSVQAVLEHPGGQRRRGDAARVYYLWVIELLVGVLCQIESLRYRYAATTLPYGLEVDVWAGGPAELRWRDDFMASHPRIPAANPLRLPQYAVGDRASFDDLLSLVVADLNNAAGQSARPSIKVPWDELLQ